MTSPRCALLALLVLGGAAAGGACSRSALSGWRGDVGGAGGQGATTSGGGGGGGQSGSDGGGGASVVCVETHDGLSLVLAGDDAALWGCEAPGYGGMGELELAGRVAAASATQLVLDTCVGTTPCPPGPGSTYVLAAAAEGMALDVVPVDAFVTLRLRATIGWGCGQVVQIRNLPAWQGAPNPVASDERLYLLAADGDLGVFDDTPFTVEVAVQSCAPQGSLCGPQGVLVLRFSPDGGPTLELPMGATEPLTAESPLRARNLRSFSNSCGAWLDWAYWVARAP